MAFVDEARFTLNAIQFFAGFASGSFVPGFCVPPGWFGWFGWFGVVEHLIQHRRGQIGHLAGDRERHDQVPEDPLVHEQRLHVNRVGFELKISTAARPFASVNGQIRRRP